MNSLPKLKNNADFLEASLATLKEECPLAYNKMCRLLAPRKIALGVDGEQLQLAFSANGAALSRKNGPTQLQIQTTRETILNLVDARLTFNEAVLEEKFQLFGPIDEIALFYKGFLLYLQGAVRSPSFLILLPAYRQLNL